MPVSKKQRAWAATAAGRKALGPEKANEWLHTTNAEIAAEAGKAPPRRKITRKEAQ